MEFKAQFLKIAVVCLTVTVIQASGYFGSSLVRTASSISSHNHDGAGNYIFGYGIVNGEGGTHSRSEEGDAWGNKRGAYYITDVDGRSRRVDYIADESGFRVFITTNEPGTAASAPAGVYIASPFSLPSAPAPVHTSEPAPAPVPTAPLYPVAVQPAASAPTGYVKRKYKYARYRRPNLRSRSKLSKSKTK